MDTNFLDSFSEEVWKTTYKHESDTTVDDTFKRVSKAIASVEKTKEDQEKWEKEFYSILTGFKFLPGGRIISNAGTGIRSTSLLNCFVGPKPKYDQDSIEGIYNILTQQALTLKSEGGWGMNFSFIRPRGSYISGISAESPGLVKFLLLFNTSSEIITSGSGKKRKKGKIKIRKGAQMFICDCWHPDVEEFITIKSTPDTLTKANLSVNCSNKFMDKIVKIEKYKKEQEKAVSKCEKESLQVLIDGLDEWNLEFPDTSFNKYKEEWDGDLDDWKSKEYPVIVYKTVKITYLWDLIMENTYKRNDPGVLFLDRANETHCWNYGGEEAKIKATNPSLRYGTKILTKSGIISINELENKKIEVYNLNGGYSQAECRLSGKNKPLFKITLSTGFEYFATKEHRWATTNGEKTTNQLIIGDKIPILKKKNIFNGNLGDQDDGFLIGWLLGDGWVSIRKDNGKSQFGFIVSEKDYNSGIGEKIRLILNKKAEFNGIFNKRIRKNNNGKISIWYEINTQNQKIEKWWNRFGSPSKDKGIPDIIFKEASEMFIKGLIDGYFSSDGYIDKNIGNSHLGGNRITFVAKNKKLLNDISEILGFYGIITSIRSSESKSSFPNCKDYNKTYKRVDLKIKDIGSLKHFQELFSSSLNYKQERLNKIPNIKRKKFNDRSYVKVRSIEDSKLKEDVWDITVFDKDNCFSLSHCITHNCGEQCLPFSAVCLLGTMNLTQFVKNGKFDFENFEKCIPTAVRFLDNTNDLTSLPLKEYEDSVRNRRRIGFGVMGWGSLLYMLKIRFGSIEAEELKEKIMKTFTSFGVATSVGIAKEKGMFVGCDPEKHSNHMFFKRIGISQSILDDMKKYGIRNSALFSNQPNGNTGIFANIVSGGIEPIFLPEYTRTVIIDSCPSELLPLVPKYWEGVFEETKTFKWVNEGSDKILRGEVNGIVYKIDKNRGLTKEVSCEDYGVRWLKNNGEWNNKADWAVTATDIDVQDHINDLVSFSKYVDSSISKTVNLPNEYPYSFFKDVYLNAYKSGVLKGVTTYRAGTMMSVLSKKDEKKEEQRLAPKRPKSIIGELHHFTLDAKKYYVAVGLVDGKPTEVFTGISEEKEIPKTAKHGFIEKAGSGKYIFLCDECEYKLTNGHNSDTSEALSRMISLSLRHNLPLSFVVDQLHKNTGPMNTFSKLLARTLKKYIPENAKSGGTCPECGHKLIYSEGCRKCPSCAFTYCS